MSRVLPALLVLALAGLMLLLPAADPLRLAALDAWPMDQDSAAFAELQPTARALIDAAPEPEPDVRVLRLGGVRVVSDLPADLDVHLLARRAFLRGLRQAHAASGGDAALRVEGELQPVAGGIGVELHYVAGELALRIEPPGAEPIVHRRAGYRPPRQSSLVPPLVAILLAVLTRRPVLSLFVGVACAATLIQQAQHGHGLIESALRGAPEILTVHFAAQVGDVYRLQIVGFVFAMLAMVGVMTTSGGIRGLMDSLARYARSARSAQISTYAMGLAVFFDDYANCILVGSTMRPLTDRFRVAREKLAYLVDSTAAPVAGLSIFSTWIAFEVSTYSAQLPAADLLPSDGYRVFVETLPVRFYCIFTLALAAFVVFSGRDFGPMLTAERRARRTGAVLRPGARPMVAGGATELEPAPGVVPRAHRALVPVLAFVVITSFEILRVGFGALRAENPAFGWSELFTLRGVTGVLGAGNSTRAILVGSSAGLLLAVLLALAGGLRPLALARAAWATLRSMGVAIAILFLAWMIGDGCKQLGTAPYLSEFIGGHLAPQLLPVALFLLGAGIAFATGSSWSTMSILLPLVVGLAYSLGEQTPELGGHALLILSIGAVLEGSIFGDHCSPLSDTTVLSSTASASDLMDHVQTQLPYALLAMAVSVVCGYLPSTFLGWPPWSCLALGIGSLLVFLALFGRRAEPSNEARPA